MKNFFNQSFSLVAVNLYKPLYQASGLKKDSFTYKNSPLNSPRILQISPLSQHLPLKDAIIFLTANHRNSYFFDKSSTRGGLKLMEENQREPAWKYYLYVSN